jgi:hypothetical protein
VVSASRRARAGAAFELQGKMQGVDERRFSAVRSGAAEQSLRGAIMEEVNPNGVKVGMNVFVEEAWEDERGHCHDEIATVMSIAKDGRIKLKFRRARINDFLQGCEWFAKDFEP